MTKEEIHQLIRDNPKLLAGAGLMETHISWVILAEHYAYKIKKPVRFSFLDFSTLDKRQLYCRRELQLNQRLTDGIYLDVLPIYRQAGGQITLENGQAEILDYTVKMRRMESEKRMDILLEKGQVSREQIEQLAEQIANFHMSTEVITAHPNLKNMQEDFADVLKVAPLIETQWGSEAALALHQGVEYSKTVLRDIRDRIYERHLEGFTVDGHGDLHARNIFLLEEPVIFDCIEFNDHFRQLDVLNELAFLCMDLDLHQQADLSEYLLETYNDRHQCIYTGVDERIFRYYKLYRANVRLKTTALGAMQTEEGKEQKKQLATVEAYLKLFRCYLAETE